MFIFQKAPVLFSHLSEEHVMIWQAAVFEMHQVIIKCFKEILFFFIEITFKINNKFLKSRHISRNSVIEKLHFYFGGSSDHSEHHVDRRQRKFILRYLQDTAAMPHHLAYIHFSPFCRGIFMKTGNPDLDFLKICWVM